MSLISDKQVKEIFPFLRTMFGYLDCGLVEYSMDGHGNQTTPPARTKLQTMDRNIIILK